jgi:hypothetical protein
MPIKYHIWEPKLNEVESRNKNCKHFSAKNLYRYIPGNPGRK